MGPPPESMTASNSGRDLGRSDPRILGHVAERDQLSEGDLENGGKGRTILIVDSSLCTEGYGLCDLLLGAGRDPDIGTCDTRVSERSTRKEWGNLPMATQYCNAVMATPPPIPVMSTFCPFWTLAFVNTALRTSSHQSLSRVLILSITHLYAVRPPKGTAAAPSHPVRPCPTRCAGHGTTSSAPTTMYSANVPLPPVCFTLPRIPKGAGPSGPSAELSQLIAGATSTALLLRGWLGLITTPTASAPITEGAVGELKMAPGYWPTEGERQWDSGRSESGDGGLTLAQEDVAMVVRCCNDLDEDLSGTGNGYGQVDERRGVVAGGTRGKGSLSLLEDDGLHTVHVRGGLDGAGEGLSRGWAGSGLRRGGDERASPSSRLRQRKWSRSSSRLDPSRSTSFLLLWYCSHTQQRWSRNHPCRPNRRSTTPPARSTSKDPHLRRR